MKKLTKKTFINNLMVNDSVKLDDGRLHYVVINVNKENFKDMNELFEKQLKEEGKYNSWIGIICEDLNGVYTMSQLPIFGNSSKYITQWLANSKEEAINNDLSDRQMRLLKRANEYIESQI